MQTTRSAGSPIHQPEISQISSNKTQVVNVGRRKGLPARLGRPDSEALDVKRAKTILAPPPIRYSIEPFNLEHLKQKNHKSGRKGPT